MVSLETRPILYYNMYVWMLLLAFISCIRHVIMMEYSGWVRDAPQPPHKAGQGTNTYTPKLVGGNKAGQNYTPKLVGGTRQDKKI